MRAHRGSAARLKVAALLCACLLGVSTAQGPPPEVPEGPPPEFMHPPDEPSPGTPPLRPPASPRRASPSPSAGSPAPPPVEPEPVLPIGILWLGDSMTTGILRVWGGDTEEDAAVCIARAAFQDLGTPPDGDEIPSQVAQLACQDMDYDYRAAALVHPASRRYPWALWQIANSMLVKAVIKGVASTDCTEPTEQLQTLADCRSQFAILPEPATNCSAAAKQLGLTGAFIPVAITCRGRKCNGPRLPPSPPLPPDAPDADAPPQYYGPFGCYRPDGWCTHQGAHYFANTDCDNDGLLDNVCQDSTGHRWVRRSSTGCAWEEGYGLPNSVCPTAFNTSTIDCVRPGDFCRQEGDVYREGIDCDDDGLIDDVCDGPKGMRYVRLSSRGCLEAYGDHLPPSLCPAAWNVSTRDCYHIDNWCGHAGSTYHEQTDCDGDGLLDNVCDDVTGHRWVRLTSTGCAWQEGYEGDGMPDSICPPVWGSSSPPTYGYGPGYGNAPPPVYGAPGSPPPAYYGGGPPPYYGGGAPPSYGGGEPRAYGA
ncbi:hypothetical protein HYH03_014981 [Edaphochlamys debaryana]|uniref:Uncharacterized protein n=1 Tax=Edaphochlamys debaryana TaxID=47281 RepID=A0A835XMX8_9CHLO|nr:hypothetical protein HYH03_014981 [Edaphochlamys debaryana]|eukprot:KAG2486405.1 hypothetical protein HYH03_014981 [Edaphochlamys debaryana]